MSHFELTLYGERLPLVQVPDSLVPMPADGMPSDSASSGSFDLLIAPVSAPNFGDPLEMVESGVPVHAGANTSDAPFTPSITNQPTDVSYLFTDSERTIELDFDDPNGETPAFFFVARDPSTGRNYPHCVWMTPAQRDGIRHGMVNLQGKFTGYADFGAGFHLSTCNALSPLHPLPPPGGVSRCPTGTFACGTGCLVDGTTCTDGAGTAGCAPGQRICGAAGCSNDPCCSYGSMDPQCCPNGPDAPPCLPPNVAGEPVRMNVQPPTAVTSGNGGGGGGSGGGGGGTIATEVWNISRPDGAIARVTIQNGYIASAGTPQWQVFNNAGDCSFDVAITGQMSGTAFDFTTSGGGCNGYMVQGTAMGQANGVFGAANQATASYSENDRTPGGTVTLNGTVRAVRVQ